MKLSVENVDGELLDLQDLKKFQLLSKSLVLKGGTAINTVIFNFPRLSVDIDLDLNKNLKKEELVLERDKIHNSLGSTRKE